MTETQRARKIIKSKGRELIQLAKEVAILQKERNTLYRDNQEEAVATLDAKLHDIILRIESVKQEIRDQRKSLVPYQKKEIKRLERLLFGKKKTPFIRFSFFDFASLFLGSILAYKYFS